VYRVGHRLLDVKTGNNLRIAFAGNEAVGPVIEGNRVFWAEAFGESSRVRETVLR
jgi:hypothetical protein